MNPNPVTGNRRYRVGGLFRSRLILQVEYVDYIYAGGGDLDKVLRWRDARVEDLMTISLVHQPHPIAEAA